ncbi:MAG TPA: NAD-dependent epimerase/dehydratase family protein [Microbacteriaceae bacterium]|nr:NAD-dependent epimerase/dehydratase family protein [Microbacteriaceae bacterium]
MTHDSAALKVLILGGTGTISASCVRLAVASGMRVTVLNRGTPHAGRELPPAVERLVGDVADEKTLREAARGRDLDAVVDFLSYDEHTAARAVRAFAGTTGQYVHISSASIYTKPLRQIPLTESSPVGPNPALPYATAKWRAEQTLVKAHDEEGFPVTIVRPSHTYDDASPVLPGGWSIIDRIARGAEVPVPGDGTSLWTLTHAEDFAQGLIGLVGNTRARGEIFTITGSDVYTWDQIYTIVAEALGVAPQLVHVPAEFYPLVAPDWFWSGEVAGDLGHSAVFDGTKIRRFVPGFAPRLTFGRAIHRILAWRSAHPDEAAPEPTTDAVIERIVGAYHAAREVFLASAGTTAGHTEEHAAS